MSSTASKKQIVDFLWDWAGNDDWAKLLISKIVSSESSLTNPERKEIFDYFLQSILLKTNLPILVLKKPTYIPATKKIELISLSDVQGVNKLAPKQTIAFSKNITVVYGENGSGKTGYGRILKALGYSYDVVNQVLYNVDKGKEPQVATINYTVDNNPSIFSWDGINKNHDLYTISVFNNKCVSISLSENRNLLVSPIGFIYSI